MRSLLLLLCLLLPACGNLINLGARAKAKQREKQLQKLTEASASEASQRLGEKAAGEVVYVDVDSGYALVRARNGLTLQRGQELECRGASTAKLKVTPERKNMFFAADIVSGVPHKGDSVIPVKGSGKPLPKLVPVASGTLPGSSAPDNTLYLDPSTFRPENLPQSTLDEPGASSAGNLLVEPPLPGDTAPPLLPLPSLPE